jgi:hypothetical protein
LCRDPHTHTQTMCVPVCFLFSCHLYLALSLALFCVCFFTGEKKAQCQELYKIKTKEFQSFAIRRARVVRRWRTTTLARGYREITMFYISSSFPVQKRDMLPPRGCPLFAPRPITN